MAMEKFRHRPLWKDVGSQPHAFPRDKHPHCVIEVRGGDDIRRP
jgi:hypothetical protein